MSNGQRERVQILAVSLIVLAITALPYILGYALAPAVSPCGCRGSGNGGGGTI